MDVTGGPATLRRYKIQPGTNEPVEFWKLVKVGSRKKGERKNRGKEGGWLRYGEGMEYRSKGEKLIKIWRRDSV